MPLILPAYAKLNLTLDVTGRRPDGYHEIESVMQTISLHDLLLVEPSDCRVFEVVGPPISGENLVLKAARELEAHVSRALPFKIRLHKRIPLGAGLGGGSSDAAAFLRAAVALYDLKLTAVELHKIAQAIGQDVPFLLHGGTSLATGLGSTVERLPPLAAEWRFVLVCPPIEVSTGAVYAAVDHAAPGGSRTGGLVSRLRAGRPPDSASFGNDLESTTAAQYPELAAGIASLRAGLPNLHMSGTGAAFFAGFPDGAAARLAMKAVSPSSFSLRFTRPIPAWS